MKSELAKQYLADFHAEVKALAIRQTLDHCFGGGKKITSDPDLSAFFCTVSAARMAIVWGVTSSTAIRRLEALQEHGVSLWAIPRKYGRRNYQLSAEDSMTYVLKAIEHWKSVGYSQTEIRPEIIEGAAA